MIETDGADYPCNAKKDPMRPRSDCSESTTWSCVTETSLSSVFLVAYLVVVHVVMIYLRVMLRLIFLPILI